MRQHHQAILSIFPLRNKEFCSSAILFDLHGVVVIPDHVHLIFTPLWDGDILHSVAKIMQGIKSASAHKINHLLNRTGQVWQRESFDRVLRREESIHAKVEYMVQNPVRVGLVQDAMEYHWLWVPNAPTARTAG